MAEHIDWDSMLSKVKIEDAVEDATLDERDKIKTPFAQIIVGGSTEKPCYSIMWWDTTSKECNIGYSSYFLGYVRKWLEEDFEIISAADVVAVVRCKDCKNAQQHPIFPFSRRCKIEDYRLPHRADHFCSYGERKGDNET